MCRKKSHFSCQSDFAKIDGETQKLSLKRFWPVLRVISIVKSWNFFFPQNHFFRHMSSRNPYWSSFHFDEIFCHNWFLAWISHTFKNFFFFCITELLNTIVFKTGYTYSWAKCEVVLLGCKKNLQGNLLQQKRLWFLGIYVIHVIKIRRLEVARTLLMTVWKLKILYSHFRAKASLFGSIITRNYTVLFDSCAFLMGSIKRSKYQNRTRVV